MAIKAAYAIYRYLYSKENMLENLKVRRTVMNNGNRKNYTTRANRSRRICVGSRLWDEAQKGGVF